MIALLIGGVISADGFSQVQIQINPRRARGVGGAGGPDGSGLAPPQDRDAESWLKRAADAAEREDWARSVKSDQGFHDSRFVGIELDRRPYRLRSIERGLGARKQNLARLIVPGMPTLGRNTIENVRDFAQPVERFGQRFFGPSRRFMAAPNEPTLQDVSQPRDIAPFRHLAIPPSVRSQHGAAGMRL